MPFVTRCLSNLEGLVRSYRDPDPHLRPDQPNKAERMLQWAATKVGLLTTADTTRGPQVYRGDVYWCDLGQNIGSEQDKTRPVLILQNDESNRNSPNTIVAPITNGKVKGQLTVPLQSRHNLTGNVYLANIRVVSKARLGSKVTSLKRSEIRAVDRALMLALGVMGYVEAARRDAQTKADDLAIAHKKLQALRAAQFSAKTLAPSSEQ